MKKRLFTMLSVCALCGTMTMNAQIQTNAGVQYLQCMQKDVSTDFSDLSNTYFLADSLVPRQWSCAWKNSASVTAPTLAPARLSARRTSPSPTSPA